MKRTFRLIPRLVSTAAQFNSDFADAYAASIHIAGSFTLTGGAQAVDLTISKPVTIDAGAALTVGANMKLIVTGTLTNNGTIVLAGEKSAQRLNQVLKARSTL